MLPQMVAFFDLSHKKIICLHKFEINQKMWYNKLDVFWSVLLEGVLT